MKRLLSQILLLTAILFVSCKEESLDFTKNKEQKNVQMLSYSFNNNQEENVVAKSDDLSECIINKGSKILASEIWKEGEDYFVASLIEEPDLINTKVSVNQQVNGSGVYTFYAYDKSEIKTQKITKTNKKFEVPVDAKTNYGIIFLSTVTGTGLPRTALKFDIEKKEMTYKANFNENLCYKTFDKSSMPKTDEVDVVFKPIFSQLGISVPVDLGLGAAEVTVDKITLVSGAQQSATVKVEYNSKPSSNIKVSYDKTSVDYNVNLKTKLNKTKDTTFLNANGGYYNVIPNGNNVSLYIEMSTDGGVYQQKMINLKNNSGTPIKFTAGKRYKLTIENKKFEDIEIVPKEATIAVGGTENFKLIAKYLGGTSSDVTTLARWSSNSPGIAKVDLKTGLVEAVSPGVATITASYLGKKLTAKVTVLDYTIEVTPAATNLKSGQTVQLTATAKYSNGKEEDVTSKATWSSNNNGAATVVDGKVVGGNPGSATITASYKVGNGPAKSGTATVTVLDYTIEVTPAATNLKSGQTVELTATAKYSDGTSENVTSKATWGSNNNGVATVVNGKVVGGNPGGATITASYKEGTAPAKSGTATITVLDYTIEVTPKSSSIQSGRSVQLTAIVKYSNGASENITDKATWGSNNNGAATVVNGKVIGNNIGSATITASYKIGTAPTKSNTASISVSHFAGGANGTYYYWDAYTSCWTGSEGRWAPGYRDYHPGNGVGAAASCASCLSVYQVRQCLAVGVWWDSNGPSHVQGRAGMWLMKPEYIPAGTGQASSVAPIHGRPPETYKYFFLPVSGFYIYWSGVGGTGSVCAYWTSTSSGYTAWCLYGKSDRVYTSDVNGRNMGNALLRWRDYYVD